MDKEDYLEIFNQLYNGKYDYSNINYRTPNINIEVICPTHGPFFVSPYHHSRNIECYKCMPLTKHIFMLLSKYLYTYRILKIYEDIQVVLCFCSRHGRFLCTWRQYLALDTESSVVPVNHPRCKQCVNKYKKYFKSSKKDLTSEKREKICNEFKKYKIKCDKLMMMNKGLYYDIFIKEYNMLIFLDDIWVNTLSQMRDDPNISKILGEYLYKHREYAESNNYRYYVFKMDGKLSNQVIEICNMLKKIKSNMIKRGKSEPNFKAPEKNTNKSILKSTSDPKITKSRSQPDLTPKKKVSFIDKLLTNKTKKNVDIKPRIK